MKIGDSFFSSVLFSFFLSFLFLICFPHIDFIVPARTALLIQSKFWGHNKQTNNSKISIPSKTHFPNIKWGLKGAHCMDLSMKCRLKITFRIFIYLFFAVNRNASGIRDFWSFKMKTLGCVELGCRVYTQRNLTTSVFKLLDKRII